MSKPKTFEAWMKQQYSHNQLADIANHGCAAGWPGLTYYSETTELYEQYKESIWVLLQEHADESGYGSVMEMLSQGNSSASCVDPMTFENHLVWFASELIAWRLTQGECLEDDEAMQDEGECNDAFLEGLNGFSGSAEFYAHSLNPGLIYTEGVQYLAKEGKAYWLIDLIAIELLPKAFKQSADYFYCLKLTVTKDRKAIIIIDDGNGGGTIIKKEIEYTDFPCVKNFTLFLDETGAEDKKVFCLMLPSEH